MDIIATNDQVRDEEPHGQKPAKNEVQVIHMLRWPLKSLRGASVTSPSRRRHLGKARRSGATGHKARTLNTGNYGVLAS